MTAKNNTKTYAPWNTEDVSTPDTRAIDSATANQFRDFASRLIAIGDARKNKATKTAD